jgi:hypothetical protein
VYLVLDSRRVGENLVGCVIEEEPTVSQHVPFVGRVAKLHSVVFHPSSAEIIANLVIL